MSELNQYRKKPVVIEAFQITEERVASNVDWPRWLHEAWNSEPGDKGAMWRNTDDKTFKAHPFLIGTLEGVHSVALGAWVIRGVRGELYPHDPDIFAETYETADTARPPCAACAVKDEALIKIDTLIWRDIIRESLTWHGDKSPHEIIKAALAASGDGEPTAKAGKEGE